MNQLQEKLVLFLPFCVSYFRELIYLLRYFLIASKSVVLVQREMEKQAKKIRHFFKSQQQSGLSQNWFVEKLFSVTLSSFYEPAAT